MQSQGYQPGHGNLRAFLMPMAWRPQLAEPMDPDYGPETGRRIESWSNNHWRAQAPGLRPARRLFPLPAPARVVTVTRPPVVFSVKAGSSVCHACPVSPSE